MKLNETNWIAAYKAAFESAKSANIATGPSDGIVCALATIRTIRDGLCDDVGKDSEEATAIRDSMSELIQQLTGKDSPKLQGFACNASSAAKCAKLDTAPSAIANALTE